MNGSVNGPGHTRGAGDEGARVTGAPVGDVGAGEVVEGRERMREQVRVRVPAKVNAQLAVGGARPDGFHDLANVFLAVGLYDEVTVAPGPVGEGPVITCTGPDAAQVPLDATNLAARAALALAARHGLAADVRIHIAKDIPVAGGMAGGSADGAGALLACDTLWGLGTPATNSSRSARTSAATSRSACSAGRPWAPDGASG